MSMLLTLSRYFFVADPIRISDKQIIALKNTCWNKYYLPRLHYCSFIFSNRKNILTIIIFCTRVIIIFIEGYKNDVGQGKKSGFSSQHSASASEARPVAPFT